MAFVRRSQRRDPGDATAMRRPADWGDETELVPGADVQLLEDLVQVVLHRSWADEQLSADLWVGKAIPSQSGYLRFLRCKRRGMLDDTSAHRFAGGQELTAGTLGEPLDPHVSEHLVERRILERGSRLPR
jgi:hypothetical protein